LLKAYTFRMLMYDDATSIYCGNEVNMCHGSMYIKEATKYKPKVAATAMMMIPGPEDEKNDWRNAPTPLSTTKSVGVLPVKALMTRNKDRTTMYIWTTPKNTKDTIYECFDL
jgi:hypothetical protein